MHDDSSLLHAGVPYNAAKAREYYLRTRHLKGRRGGVKELSVLRDSPGSQGTLERIRVTKKSSGAKRQAAKVEVAALNARLDRLREVLRVLVEQAKGRSGVETKSQKETPDSKDSKGDKGKSTAKEKAAAKKSYEKNKEKVSPSKELEQLQAKIKDIRAQIKEAIEKARNSKSKTASKAVANH